MTFPGDFGVTSALIGVLVAFLFIYWKRFRTNHLWKRKGIPHEEPLPLIGNDLDLFRRKTFFELDYEWYKRHGRMYGIYTGSTPVLCVSDPEIVKRVLVKDFQALSDRRELKTPSDILNSFMTTLKGDEWRRVRSVVTPAFASGKLRKMVKLLLECGDAIRNTFLKYAESGDPVDIKPILATYTLDVIASAAFGTKLNSHQDPNNIFVKNAKKIFNVEFSWKLVIAFIFPKLALWLKISPISDEATEFFRDLSLSIVDRRRKNKEIHDDFLNGLMEAQRNSCEEVKISDSETKSGLSKSHERLEKKQEDTGDVEEDGNHSYFKDYSTNKTISSTELVSQCVLFFLAGYDTTATTLSMALYYLAQNPDCQDRVLEEVDTAFKKYDTVDAEALSEMKYTDAVISETLRLSPPATRLERVAVEDYTVGDTGLTIPKGTMIGIPIYGMHRDPEFFPNPEKFDPERFLPENKDLIQPYTYLPFGMGPRNCLGMRFALMEIKLGLLQVLRDYKFRVSPDTLIPMEFLRGTLLYQPKSVTLKVVRRNMRF